MKPTFLSPRGEDLDPEDVPAFVRTEQAVVVSDAESIGAVGLRIISDEAVVQTHDDRDRGVKWSLWLVVAYVWSTKDPDVVTRWTSVAHTSDGDDSDEIAIEFGKAIFRNLLPTIKEADDE